MSYDQGSNLDSCSSHSEHVLPPELVLAIMEEVYSSEYGRNTITGVSRSTLASCSLTCRQWNTCAQPFHFRDILIYSDHSLEKFIALLDSSPWVGNVVVNLTMVDEASAAIRSPYRTEAVIPIRAEILARESQSKSHRDPDAPRDPYPDDIRKAVFDVFPSKLSALRTITLVGYDDRGEHLSRDALHSLSRMTSVVKLTLDNCVLAPVVFQSMARSLLGLQELLMIDLMQDVSPDASHDNLQTAAVDSRPRLQSLSCYAGPWNRTDISLEWIINSPSRYMLRSLSIMFEIDDPEPFGLLLREVGPHLQHLSFEVEGTPLEHWVASSRHQQHINLSMLTNLKTLVIRANVRAKLLYHFIPQISSPSLSLLVVVMSNIECYARYFKRHSFPDLFERISHVHSNRTRIVFANDPISHTIYVPVHENIEEQGENEEEQHDEENYGVPQTADMLESYLDRVFSASMSSVQYEVMSFCEASKLETARPIDM